MKIAKPRYFVLYIFSILMLICSEVIGFLTLLYNFIIEPIIIEEKKNLIGG